jgi:hypothetical protein
MQRVCSRAVEHPSQVTEATDARLLELVAKGGGWAEGLAIRAHDAEVVAEGLNECLPVRQLVCRQPPHGFKAAEGTEVAGQAGGGTAESCPCCQRLEWQGGAKPRWAIVVDGVPEQFLPRLPSRVEEAGEHLGEVGGGLDGQVGCTNAPQAGWEG